MSRTFLAENTTPAICRLIEEVVAYLKGEGLTPRSLFISELVLEEMLTNIIKYSYDDELVHQIKVEAAVRGDRVHLQLHDDGHRFDPTQAEALPAGVPLAEMKVGGRGISLVRKFVSEIGYRREEGWNILSLGFPSQAVSSPK
jgi:anti-sigma regulatory factor (Ser/Thr protein kinase)